ncbi:MAG: hypothetical protein ABIR68_10465 [Ilumatobacteraceae bacterium]
MSTACAAGSHAVVGSRSDALRRRLKLVGPAGWDCAGRLRGDPRAAELYPSLLMLQHMIVRGSVPLLRAAGREALRRAAAGDRVAALLVDHFRRHAEEERREEQWLLDDYTALDRDATEVIVAVPWSTVAAMVGAAYYWVLHHHPVAVLGYFAVLDGDRPSPVVVADLQAATGFPVGAFTTLAHRAVADPAERNELWRLIDVMPMGAAQIEVVTRSAVLSARLLAAAVDELLGGGLAESA